MLRRLAPDLVSEIGRLDRRITAAGRHHRAVNQGSCALDEFSGLDMLMTGTSSPPR
jgi:hypothetical protein